MDGGRHQLLTRPRLAQDQDAEVHGSHLYDLSLGQRNGIASAYNGGQAVIGGFLTTFGDMD